MKYKKVAPNKILTTRDFPVFNGQILKIYFRMCQKGQAKLLPPTPLMRKSLSLPLLKEKTAKAKKYNKRIRDYFKKNPEVEYTMLDGSHKTTALALTHNKVNAMIFENDADIKRVRRLIEKGEIFSLATGDSIKDIIREKAEHLIDAEFFETVEDKTRRMIEERILPQYMINFYKKANI